MDNVLKADDVLKIGTRGYKEYVDYNWHGKMIRIRYLLSSDEFCSLIDDIESMCKTSSGDIAAGFIDFSLRLNIVMAYADIDLQLELDDIYRVLYHSNLFDIVIENANNNQIDAILRYFGYLGRWS